MKYKKIYSIFFLTILIVSLSYVGYNCYKNSSRQRPLSHDELTGYINKFCLYNKGKNLKIESEKDIDDLHTVLLSYEDSNYNRSICFVVLISWQMANINIGYTGTFHHHLLVLAHL